MWWMRTSNVATTVLNQSLNEGGEENGKRKKEQSRAEYEQQHLYGAVCSRNGRFRRTSAGLYFASITFDADGQRTDGDAFGEEVEKAFARGGYPVFVATINGQTKYILAMYGAGLWGPVWGYLAVNDDCNTVFGADFSHASETPGLGAEITSKAFSGQFPGKQLFRDGVFKSIAVVKSGNKAEGQDYVDGISGGTITSNGVNAMLRTSIGSYAQFLTTQKQ